jgi:hypothetical protein
MLASNKHMAFAGHYLGSNHAVDLNDDDVGSFITSFEAAEPAPPSITST